MKKLVLSVAVLLGSLSTFASNTIAPTVVSVNEIVMQDEYTEIGVDALPAAVKASIESAMPGAVVEKAYINEKKEYKLEVKVADQSTTIFTDANGAIVKK
ncbi:hypothetical protein [Flavobacterium frigoris]|uniref:Beta-lactamase-inhibitor-like PepSY-like domain-containing protein n=1 Tax=Flavobacterium frigoris (strain PS1) TaxID=1086011 RepID=H7FPN5_FLAFP|nr:hypothetical protein [Flavobacterium frigoris]EIA09239.1 hypothetical protein HJ01_01145 [Flavobacterium frigoris PS1]